jgi:hypothetical protein
MGEHSLEVIFQHHRQKIADNHGRSSRRLPGVSEVIYLPITSYLLWDAEDYI